MGRVYHVRRHLPVVAQIGPRGVEAEMWKFDFFPTYLSFSCYNFFVFDIPTPKVGIVSKIIYSAMLFPKDKSFCDLNFDL